MRIPIRIIAFALFMAAPGAASAQTYCAMYSDGEKTCGIANLQICLQSVSGVGGYCEPDQNAQIPPNFMQRRFQQMDPNEQRILHPPNPQESQPGGLNWMPPPPGQ